MKKPMSKGTRATSEKPQGKIKGSGVNKAMPKNSVPQVVARNTYGNPGTKRPMG